MKLRYHIQASGSDEHPDLDYFADEYPHGLMWKYPVVRVALLSVIPLKALHEARDAVDGPLSD